MGPTKALMRSWPAHWSESSTMVQLSCTYIEGVDGTFHEMAQMSIEL